MIDFNDDFGELPSDDLFPDEGKLKKEIASLNRKLAKFRDEQAKDIKRLEKLHESHINRLIKEYSTELEDVRSQNRNLFERYHELHEMNRIFVKGLENLRKDNILVQDTIPWSRKGLHGSLENRISQLRLNGKRVINICITKMDNFGCANEALILVEFYNKK